MSNLNSFFAYYNYSFKDRCFRGWCGWFGSGKDPQSAKKIIPSIFDKEVVNAVAQAIR